MALLVVNLQSGFSDDTVVVQINDQIILNKKHVSTDYSLGLADSFEIQNQEKTVNIIIDVKTRKISSSITLEMSTSVYLGVSIDDNKICFKVSDEMFLYY